MMHLRLLGALLAIVWMVHPGVASAQTLGFKTDEKRVALVIGVSAYERVSALPNPRNDADAVAASLQRLGFDVLHHVDPNRADLEDLEAEFRRRTLGADIAILYYAGHSIQVDGRNFLIPTDARFEKPQDFATFLVGIDDLIAVMDQNAAVHIVILDACRDNPFLIEAQDVAQTAESNGAPSRALGRGLAAIPASRALAEAQEGQVYGSIVAYAAAPGDTASDGVGRNSPYTAALLQHLEEPGLEIGRMFRQVAKSVIEETGGDQQPEYLVRLTDEVYFKVPEPSDCDFLAAAPYNSIGVTGVDFETIDTARAIPACQAALEADPDHPRVLYNLGRALDAAGDFRTAVAYYRQSSDLGYAAAKSSLGVMYVNGQGVDQDFVQGVALLNAARDLGARTAKISLTYSDFSVLFEQFEFEEVQSRLKELGFYDGRIDGDFGPMSQRAVKAFQTRNKLARNGLTLETLDALDLLEIIPNYELN